MIHSDLGDQRRSQKKGRPEGRPKSREETPKKGMQRTALQK
jgi:hypothetical protein